MTSQVDINAKINAKVEHILARYKGLPWPYREGWHYCGHCRAGSVWDVTEGRYVDCRRCGGGDHFDLDMSETEVAKLLKLLRHFGTMGSMPGHFFRTVLNCDFEASLLKAAHISDAGGTFLFTASHVCDLSVYCAFGCVSPGSMLPFVCDLCDEEITSQDELRYDFFIEATPEQVCVGITRIW